MFIIIYYIDYIDLAIMIVDYCLVDSTSLLYCYMLVCPVRSVIGTTVHSVFNLIPGPDKLTSCYRDSCLY